MVIHLGRASPHASSGLPGGRADHTLRRQPAAPLFGLAPGRVYPATAVASSAVRSYRTISPLPATARRRQTGGIFSAALSVGLRPPGITWHPVLWSPDFPPSHLNGGNATIRPTPWFIKVRAVQPIYKPRCPARSQLSAGSHALRGNPVRGWGMKPDGAGAPRGTFPRRAWERWNSSCSSSPSSLHHVARWRITIQ